VNFAKTCTIYAEKIKDNKKRLTTNNNNNNNNEHICIVQNKNPQMR